MPRAPWAIPCCWIRLRATMVGGFLAGIGGSFLSLFYPGSWNEGLSSGQGITAVALVIFARWDPMLCLWASLAFGGAAALGPGAAIGRRHLRLSSVQRRALHPDAGDHDHHLLAEAHADRRAGRTVHHPISESEPCPSATSNPNPMPGPIMATCARKTPRSSSSTCRPISAASAAMSTRWAMTSR